MQNRQKKGRRLAGSRLCGGDDISTGEDGRDGFRLYGSRLGISNLAGGPHQCGVQAERCKWHSRVPEYRLAPRPEWELYAVHDIQNIRGHGADLLERGRSIAKLRICLLIPCRCYGYVMTTNVELKEIVVQGGNNR